MFWPVLTCLCLALALAIHLRWRVVLRRRLAEAAVERQHLLAAQQDERGHILARQDALLNTMAEGILLVDPKGHIQLVNAALSRLFNVQGELRNRSLIESLRHHELVELAAKAAENVPTLGYELRLSSPSERWLEVNACPVSNGSGSPPHVLFVFHDVTRLKKLEAARRDFVANVSHELRTPLSLIKGCVETLIDGAKDQPAVADKFLRTIDRNAERLRALMEDLLTISELESGAARIDLQEINLGPLLRKVCEDLQERAAARKIVLVTEVADVIVRADSHRLEQVFCNLIDNAIKYGREGGRVTISAHRPGSEPEIEIWVADDGPGIPRESLERVFERFYRVDKARSREQGGTGLGLSIVKHIVLNHGGRIRVESEPGKGATFKVSLPVAASA